MDAWEPVDGDDFVREMREAREAAWRRSTKTALRKELRDVAARGLAHGPWVASPEGAEPPLTLNQSKLNGLSKEGLVDALVEADRTLAEGEGFRAYVEHAGVASEWHARNRADPLTRPIDMDRNFNYDFEAQEYIVPDDYPSARLETGYERLPPAAPRCEHEWRRELEGSSKAGLRVSLRGCELQVHRHARPQT